MTDRKGIRQAFRFIITGLLAAGVDYGVYILLFQPLGVSPAKAVSFIAATLFTYIMNKLWTFEQAGRSIRETTVYILFYAVSLIINTLINKIVFSLTHLKEAGFIAATAFCALFNFFGLKYVVFRKKAG